MRRYSSLNIKDVQATEDTEWAKILDCGVEDTRESKEPRLSLAKTCRRCSTSSLLTRGTSSPHVFRYRVAGICPGNVLEEREAEVT